MRLFQSTPWATLSLALLVASASALHAQTAPANGNSGSDLLAPGLSRPVPANSAPAAHVAGLPVVELTGELLYQILAADFAAQRGAWAAAINTSMQVSRNTRDPRLAQRALEFALASNNLPRAWDAARLWVELSPGDPHARQAEVMLAASNGHTHNLAAMLVEQVAATTDKGEALLQTQAILSRLSNQQAAYDIMRELTQNQPWQNLPEARAALAESAWQAGDTDTALREARAAQQLRPDWSAAAEMILEFGINTEPDAVLAETARFIERNPQARGVRLAFVSALMSQGRADAALAELQAMMRAQPEDFELLYLRGVVNYEAGRTDEAVRWLNEYIAVETDRRQSGPRHYDPASSLPDAEMLRARIAENAGQLDEAWRLLNAVVAPEAQVQAGLRKAIVRAKQGRLTEAMRELDGIAVQDEREGVVVELTRAQVLREAGELNDAVQSLEQALMEYPDSTEIRYDLALLYERQNRIAELEYQLRQIIEVDPEAAHAYNALGYTLADRSIRLDEARQLIEQALALQPQDPAILDSMGWVMYRQGDLAGALLYLEQAWERLPDAEIGTHLGEVLWVNGQADRALAIWAEVAASSPENPLLAETLHRLNVNLPGVEP